MVVTRTLKPNHVHKAEPKGLRNRGVREKLSIAIEGKVLTVVDKVKTTTETPIPMEVVEGNEPVKNDKVEPVLLAHTLEMDEDPETDEYIRNFADNENAAKLKTIMIEKNRTIALWKLKVRELEREIERLKRLNIASNKKKDSLVGFIEELTLRLLTEQTEAENIPDVIKCDLCNNSFESNDSLKEHKESVHENHSNLGITCEQCEYIPDSSADLVEHIRNIHLSHKCRECDFQSNSEVFLNAHINNTHANNTSPTVSTVENRLDEPNEISNTIVDNSTDNAGSLETNTIIRCRLCVFSATTTESLRNHMKIKHKSHKPCSYFARNECRFGDQCRYNHIILNRGELICFECGEKFSDKSSLANHIRNVHGDMSCKRSQCKYKNGNCYYKHHIEGARNDQPFLGVPNHQNPPPGPQVMNQQQTEKMVMVECLKKMTEMVMKS